MIALTLAGLLHREAREIINLYAPISGKAGRFRASTTYTEETPASSRLAEIFRLNELKTR